MSIEAEKIVPSDHLNSHQQEPVAFRNTETGDFCTGGFLRKDWAKWQPLYAAPARPVVHAVRCTYPQCQATNGCVGACSKGQAEKQEPVVGTKTWFEDGKMVTQHLYASDISQERVDETAKREHELAGTIPISNGGIATSTPTDFFAPPKREWVGLTDEERRSIREWQRIQEELGPVWAPMMLYLYLAIEAKLREKNS